MATKIPMSVTVIDPYPPKEAKEAKNVSPKSVAHQHSPISHVRHSQEDEYKPFRKLESQEQPREKTSSAPDASLDDRKKRPAAPFIPQFASQDDYISVHPDGEESPEGYEPFRSPGLAPTGPLSPTFPFPRTRRYDHNVDVKQDWQNGDGDGDSDYCLQISPLDRSISEMRSSYQDYGLRAYEIGLEHAHGPSDDLQGSACHFQPHAVERNAPSLLVAKPKLPSSHLNSTASSRLRAEQAKEMLEKQKTVAEKATSAIVSSTNESFGSRPATSVIPPVATTLKPLNDSSLKSAYRGDSAQDEDLLVAKSKNQQQQRRKERQARALKDFYTSETHRAYNWPRLGMEYKDYYRWKLNSDGALIQGGWSGVV